jgi:NAD(P)-dependent dehydrogenase (short-subunit alcohol dehydrogenase family)
MRLDEKVAVITGAAEGIGRSCALQFARAGAAVVVADRNTKAGEETAHAIAAAGGQAMYVPVDVADEGAVEQLFRRTLAHYGTLDVLVSNAGIGGRSLGDGPVHQCTLEAWEQIMAVNLRGTFLTCKHALPPMFERGGSIVTIASVLGLVGTQGLFDTHAYATSKAGIIGLTRNIAAHYARQRIRANVIAPGLIDTRMAARTKANPAIAEQVAFWQPLGVVGQPGDVASAAIFLASDESRFITGAVLPVDGGWTVQ